MYTCHRYGGDPTKEAIQSIIDFRDKVNLPMYMGERGHNMDEWQAAFCQTMRDNNIGYTFWPYKKMDGSSLSVLLLRRIGRISFTSEAPAHLIRKFVMLVPTSMARKAMMDFIEACKLKTVWCRRVY